MANHIIFFAIGLKGSLAGEGEGEVIPGQVNILQIS